MAEATSSTKWVWVAIDVAKRWNEVLVEPPQGRRRRFKMAQTRDDYESLAAYLHSFSHPCKIALEPTGDYHRPLAYFLRSQGFEVSLISSLSAARTREALFNSRDKNDPKDSEVLLRLLKQGVVQTYYDPLWEGFHDIQEISKTYYQVTLRRTRVLHSLLTHYLPIYFPEMERYFHASRAQWLARTLTRFPTPQSMTRYDLDTFVEQAWTVVGRKVNKRDWLTELYEVAQNSIGLPIQENSLAVASFRLVLQEFLHLNDLRQKIESMAEGTLETSTDYQRLKTLPGVGPILAMTLLAEAGDLRRFRHHRQFLKYCGFNLATYQSGLSRGQSRLSKRGNARLRQAFWMAAAVAIRQRENSFRTKYENYIRKDPSNADLKRKAYTAVAAKMARVAYALIKSGIDYRGYHEAAIPSGKIPIRRAVGAFGTP